MLLLALVSVLCITAAEPVSLTVWNRTIIEFRAPIGFASVEDRAQRAVERIGRLPDEALTMPIEAKPAKVGELSGVMIYAGPHFLFAIADQDLDASSGDSMVEVSQQAMERVRELFAARMAAQQGPALLHSLLLSVASTIGLVVALFLVVYLRRRSTTWLHPGLFASLPTIAGMDVRGGALNLAHGLMRLPFIATGLTLIYGWLTLVLGLFPYTKPWADTLGGWLAGLMLTLFHGLVGALPGLVVVLIIVLLTRVATRSLTAFFTGVEEGRFQVGWMEPETARASRRIAVVLLWLFAIIISYPYLPGSSSEAFKGISVFAGLILTLGSSGMVSQVMSGLVVVYARSMRQGDIVQVNGVIGTVVDLGVLATKVRTANHEEVSIPNSVLVGSSVTNFSRHDADGMVIHATVSIGYDTPWRQVHALLIQAATRTPGIRAAPEPMVVQKALDDFYVAYELRARLVLATERFRVQSALFASIQDVFNEHGVQIMSPHFVAQPSQPVLAPTVPA